MKPFKILVIALLITACSHKTVMIEELILKDNVYFEPQNRSIPYTGFAISKFESGRTANKISFIKGVPSGTWISYGYKGEVIQKGTYRPFYLKFANIASIKSIKRINICTVMEGNEIYDNIYIVSSEADSAINKKSNIYKAILDTLSLNGIAVKKNAINKITCVKKEVNQ